SSTERWYGVPRGTMDEVSSHVRLDLPTIAARPPQRSFESHDGRALVPIPKRSASPRATFVVDGLKRLTLTGRLEKRTLAGVLCCGAKRVSALSKHLLEPVRCSLLGGWRVAR